MQSKILSRASTSISPFERIFQLSSAAIIIFECSFYLFDQKRHSRLWRTSIHGPLNTALEQYMASPHAAAVWEAVSNAVHTYQGSSSTWKAMLGFESAERKFINTILEIILQHRLQLNAGPCITTSTVFGVELKYFGGT
ncbi:uncharacterized protein BJ212DRAFT_1484823 [Suillus subaureus]|uniref:Uncharacterized protein n=1 Tax=Suillus subaureus TaxID=48587 RepID=A0A9P7E237_9AGAM|nr:uncharacterized protein BJ212DRAFT_1484823 [Suillus subaureus]KAG1808965.1 hypothetical protein BJ212DRAFT_1484823 [Suillus subaureus]